MTEPSPPGWLDATRVDPERLALVLRDAGWELVGVRNGAYLRFAPPGAGSARTRTVRIPLDASAPEYHDDFTQALRELEQLASRTDLPQILARTLSEPADQFRFRKETAAPSGLITWAQGEELFASARAALVAGAKTFMSPMKYYSNRYGQFANRYLNSVFMGQTSPGSFIVTAFAPVTHRIPVSTSASSGGALWEEDESASGRDIALSVVRAVGATLESVAHYRRAGTLTAFEALVGSGVSYEMTSALRGLAADSDGASVSVEWDPAVPQLEASEKVTFEFGPGDAEVLNRAATMLASTASEPERATVVGRVHLLSKQERGGPGLIGVENLSGGRPRKLRVRLSAEDYSKALHAHDDDRAVVVEGTIEREGNLHWVYDGRLKAVLEDADEVGALRKTRPAFQLPGQLAFGRETPPASEEDETF